MTATDPVVWGFKAIKPFDAEHPIGTGTMVHYDPGDEVPASDWGRAEGFMIEAGTIMRYARNVAEVPGQITTAPRTGAQAESDAVVETEPLPDGAVYPHHKGGPVWVLSDGSEFHGKKAAALAAQAGLEIASEGGTE